MSFVFFLVPDMLLIHEKEGCICLLPKGQLFGRHQSSVCQSWVLHVALELEPSNKGRIIYVASFFLHFSTPTSWKKKQTELWKSEISENRNEKTEQTQLKSQIELLI